MPGADSGRAHPVPELRRFRVPSTWKWIEPGSASIRLVNGRHEWSPKGAYVMLSSVTYGDLNGDGREDAAVDLRYGTGGTGNWHYLYVYADAPGRPILLGVLQSGSRADGGLLRCAIQRNPLVLDFADADRALGACCSEGYVRVTYRLQRKQFLVVGTREYGDLTAP